MAWDDLQAGLSELRHSPLESERFDVSISRLTVGFGWQQHYASASSLYAALGGVVEAASDRIVIVRAPSDLVRIASAASSGSRSVLGAGSLIYWEAGTDALAHESLPRGYAVRLLDATDSRSADAGALIAVIADSFEGYVNHYSYNPLLREDLVTAGYREWASSALAGTDGAAYVLTFEGEPIGAATVRTLDRLPGVAEIELAGMVSAAQGGGRYRYLLEGVAAILRSSGSTSLVISTQSQNVRVQRAWASAGLRPIASLETTHWIRAE